MPDFTITFNGIPHRVRGARDRGQAQRFIEASAAKDPVLWKNTEQARIAQLRELGIDLERNFATEGMGGGEKFLVGAGRTFTEVGRGIKQIAGGEVDDTLIENERETFDLLDDDGIGMEDLGQLAPELFAFIGTGGGSVLATAANMGVRGALLGAAREATSEESRTLNAVLSGAFAAGGGAAARGVASMFSRGAQFTASMAAGLQKLIGRNGGETAANISKATLQAQALANSKNQALREVGEASLKEMRTLIQQMNAVGRESVFRSQVNSWMQKSIKELDGVNVLDVNKFIANLETMSRGQLVKELGKNIGPRLDALRTTFRELGKLGNMESGQASQVLRGIMSDNAAASAAQALARASEKGASQSTLNRLGQILLTTVARSPLAAGAGSGGHDVVDQVLKEAEENGITLNRATQ